MNKIRATTNLLIILAFGSSGIFLSSCKGKKMDGMIIFTQVNGIMHDTNNVTGDSWQYIPQARIVALDPDKPEGLKVLTEGYFSARSPELSYDGTHLLFTARKKQNDAWQIWEMNFENSKIRHITSSTDNCIDPAYLPGGRLVFSRLTTNDTVKTVHSLYTCDLDGSDIKQITFNPNTYFASTVLKDGRVLTISRQIYPDQRDVMLMILRPDGTKEQLFYQGLKGSELHSRSWETKNGKIVFIESDNSDQQGGNVISINYNRPLHSRVNLSSGIKGDFCTISPLQSGKLLVSYRSSDSDPMHFTNLIRKIKHLVRSFIKILITAH